MGSIARWDEEGSRGQAMKNIEPLQRIQAYWCEQAIYFGNMPLVQIWGHETTFFKKKTGKKTCTYEKYFLHFGTREAEFAKEIIILFFAIAVFEVSRWPQS